MKSLKSRPSCIAEGFFYYQTIACAASKINQLFAVDIINKPSNNITETRNFVEQSLPSTKQRQSFWQDSLAEEILVLLAAGKLKEAEEKIRYATCSIGIES